MSVNSISKVEKHQNNALLVAGGGIVRRTVKYGEIHYHHATLTACTGVTQQVEIVESSQEESQ